MKGKQGENMTVMEGNVYKYISKRDWAGIKSLFQSHFLPLLFGALGIDDCLPIVNNLA